MGTTDAQQGFNARTVSRLTGLTHRKLVYLDKTGLVRPSIQPASGSGSRRVYSFDDLVALRALAEMRTAGLSLQRVRGVVEQLTRKHPKPLASISLVLEGDRVFIRTDSPRTLEELTADGQFAMVLPVAGLVRRLTEKVSEISAAREFTVRVRGRAYKAIATPDLEIGGYSVSVPDIKGCHTQGDTMAEARSMAKDAVSAMLDYAAEAQPKRVAR